MIADQTAVLKRIHLTLARSKEFPDGSPGHGYDMIAPLDGRGHIDLAAWKKERANCTVRHFKPGQAEEFGMLVHKPGGNERGRWVFDYDTAQKSDDEAGYLFGTHAFAPGEYVSVTGEDGKVHTFRVASVDAVV